MIALIEGEHQPMQMRERWLILLNRQGGAQAKLSL